MTPGLIERYQVYVLGPNQDSRLASVAASGTAGSVIGGLQLNLDSDAPFILRGRSLRVKYDSSRYQTGLNHILLRWAGPDRNYQSQDFIRQTLLSPYAGQGGNPIPVWPNVVYPRNGIIQVDLKNDGSSALTNVSLYFHGVKLFHPGSVKSYTYPSFTYPPRALPFTYPEVFSNLPVTCGFSGGTGPAIRQAFRTKNNKVIADADFVMRGAQTGLPFATTPVNETFVKLLDEDEKPYMNDAVHTDVLFGNSGAQATYPAGTSAGVAPIGGGPAAPGWFYPEIYIPKNHSMYIELSRNDGAYAGATTMNFPIDFSGMKVFVK